MDCYHAYTEYLENYCEYVPHDEDCTLYATILLSENCYKEASLLEPMTLTYHASN